jgi:hypothetical protein
LKQLIPHLDGSGIEKEYSVFFCWAVGLISLWLRGEHCAGEEEHPVAAQVRLPLVPVPRRSSLHSMVSCLLQMLLMQYYVHIVLCKLIQYQRGLIEASTSPTSPSVLWITSMCLLF